MFKASKNREDFFSSFGIVQERDRGCIVEGAHRGTEPAHGVRPITDDFHCSANDGGLGLIVDFEGGTGRGGLRFQVGAGKRRAGLGTQA